MPEPAAGGAAGADVVCIASWNADLVVRVPRPPARGETLTGSDFGISPGGKGSNAAVAAARQGARVALLARVGDDDFGRMGLALWRAEGIDTRQVETVPGAASGIAQIQVFDDGDNSIVVAPGANAGLAAHHAVRVAPMLRAARVVMASLEVPLACTLAAFSIARQAGATTLLNPAPSGPLSEGLLPLVDILTPNAGELRNLAGAAPDADEAQCAQRLLARGAGAVVVTLGAHGCRLYQPGGSAPTAWAGHVVQVIDTVGAGDTFTGTLAAALARGDTLAHAVLQANAAAALSVRGRGATTAMPDRQAVRALLAQRPGARDGRAG